MEVTKCNTYRGLRRKTHNLRQNKIRRNILEQFTFYDIYYDVISQLEDDEAGRFAKRICNYAFNGVDSHGKTENENCFWEIIYPTLNDATAIEKQDKKPYYLNRKMKHFTFYAAYARMLNTLKDDASAGQFVKAMCGYMLESVEPTELKPPVDAYFKLFRKSLDLSKVRSESGRKGGKAKKKDEETPLAFTDFLARNPQIKDDVYSEKLKKGVDWTALNHSIHKSEEWKSETSLYRIISNRSAIIGT